MSDVLITPKLEQTTDDLSLPSISASSSTEISSSRASSVLSSISSKDSTPELAFVKKEEDEAKVRQGVKRELSSNRRTTRSDTKRVKIEAGIKTEVNSIGSSNSGKGIKQEEEDRKVKVEEDVKPDIKPVQDWVEYNSSHLPNAFIVPTTRLPSLPFPAELKNAVFTRAALAGLQQATASPAHVPSRAKYGNFRLTLDPHRNLIPVKPFCEGLPFIWLADRIGHAVLKYDNHQSTVFINIASRARPGGACWKYIGRYEITSFRKARDGEFSDLTDERKEEVVQVFYKYHLAKEGTLSSRWLFRDTTRLDDERARSSIREDLKRNYGSDQEVGLLVGYALMEFRGCDDDEEELKDIRNR